MAKIVKGQEVPDAKPINQTGINEEIVEAITPMSDATPSSASSEANQVVESGVPNEIPKSTKKQEKVPQNDTELWEEDNLVDVKFLESRTINIGDRDYAVKQDQVGKIPKQYKKHLVVAGVIQVL